MIANDQEMDETVFTALCACLGVAAGTDAANRLIHKAYIEPENAPQPPRELPVRLARLEAVSTPKGANR